MSTKSFKKLTKFCKKFDEILKTFLHGILKKIQSDELKKILPKLKSFELIKKIYLTKF